MRPLALTLALAAIPLAACADAPAVSTSEAPLTYGHVNAVLHTRYSGDRTMLVTRDRDDDDPDYITYDLVDVDGNAFFPRDGLFHYDSSTPAFGDGAFFDGDDDHLVEPNGQTAAADAYVAVGVTWQMFREVLGLLGPTDNGQGMPVRVHEDFDGILWYPIDREIEIGYLSTTELPMRPAATIDLVGSALGHAFFDHFTDTAEGVGVTELDALRVATGDLVGTAAECYRRVAWGEIGPVGELTSDCDWALGAGTGTTVRAIDYPPTREWTANLAATAGSVEQLAGPMDRMLYALSEGLGVYATSPPLRRAFRVPDGFTGVGRTQALRIWAEAVRGLGAGATFADARVAALAAAERQHGWSSDEKKAVGDAFAAVAVGPLADRTPPTIGGGTATQLPEYVNVTFSVSGAGTGFDRMMPLVVVDNTVKATALYGDPHAPLLPSALPVDFVARVPTRLLAGLHNHAAVIKAWDEWGNLASKSISFSVDQTAPTLTASVGGAGKYPTITAAATDASGVSRVEVKRGGALIGTDLGSPYGFQLDTSTWPDGDHAITVTAYDVWENQRTLTFTITADNSGPTATLGTTSTMPPFTMTAAASDAHPIVQAVFSLDGVEAGTDLSAPFQTVYTPVDAAPHTFAVRLRDSYGNESTTTATAPRDVTPPSIAASALQDMYTLHVVGAADDTCGIAPPLTVIADGFVIGQPADPAFDVLLPSNLFAAGPHWLAVEATDHCGNLARVDVAFSIHLNIPIVHAAVVETANQPKHPKITATVTHDHPIHSVVFWRASGGQRVVLGEDTTAPYELTLDTSTWADGPHTIETIATDDASLPGLDSVTVTADNTAPVAADPGWSIANHTVTFWTTAADNAGGSGLAQVELGIFIYVDDFVSPAPYVLSYTIPPAVTGRSLIFVATAKDRFGNATTVGKNLRVTCSNRGCTGVVEPPLFPRR